ncbi:MAG: hypothetical protein K1X94_32440, partial [Sandaracinaceae bacterium]|nr:hypothetical protein [Sandaracinaceae bacterium]
MASTALSLFVASCGGGPDEGLVVSAQTDFVPVAEFGYVHVEVDGDDGFDLDVSPNDDFTRPHPIHAYQGVEHGRRVVEVTLVDRAGEPLVSRRVQVDFHGSQLVNVVLARSCLDVRCSAEETCSGGVCVPPTCVLGTEDSCPRPQCTSADTCTSATACVRPSCVAGICLETGDDDACEASQVCVPAIGCIARPSDDDGGLHPMDAGAADASSLIDAPSFDAPMGCSGPSDCDDGRSCTVDTCSVDRLCVHTPDDALCPESACVPTDPSAGASTGCLPACDASTCVPNPCETATCVAGRCERATTCAGGEMCCSGTCAIDCAMVGCAGQPSGTVCRASRGDCDPPEVCDGTSPTCPDDALHDAAHVCRAASGTCDVAESCS